MTDDHTGSSVAEWIVNDLTEDRPDAFLQAVAERLVGEGVPIGRCAILIRTPHPTLMGRTHMWVKGEGVRITTVPTQARTDERFLNSPVYPVFNDGAVVRQRICDGEGLDRYDIIRDLHAEGGTDYLAYPLTFLGGENHALTWACYEPGGFSAADIGVLMSIQKPIARVAQIFALQWTAENLLNAYVGPGTGGQIMKGRHHLGDSVRINAVVCFCDLRGSVRLAEHYGTDRFLEELNRFYGCTAIPVQRNGGEILRFIGDAFLAIFPIESFGGTDAACTAALTAAREALAALQGANTSRRVTGDPAFDCGIGLHIGEVLYGNIGTNERLEFTVIGSVANETARIEGKCRDLGLPILVSEAFAATHPGPWRDMGEHEMRNVTRPMRLFAPSGSAGVSRS